MAQTVAARMGLLKPDVQENQYDLLRRLQDEGVLPREIYQLFGEIRRAGNDASHKTSGDGAQALNMLKIAWQLGSGSSAHFSS